MRREHRDHPQPTPMWARHTRWLSSAITLKQMAVRRSGKPRTPSVMIAWKAGD
jgi:hypothetical protein